MKNTAAFVLIASQRNDTMVSMATKTAKNSSSKTQVRYIVNDKGERTEVVLPIQLYERLINEIEELQDIRDFDKAMEKGEWEDFEEVAKRLGV
jgi:enolase